MKKPFFKWVCVLSFALLLLSSPALATEDENVEVILQIGNDTVYINGEATTIAVEPYISNSATLVPLRLITESFGATVGWNQETRTVSLFYEDKFIQLTIDHAVALVNGVAEELQTAAELKSGTTMVPIRMITEHFGATVDWDQETRMITIVKEVTIAEEEYEDEDFPLEPQEPEEPEEPSGPDPADEPDKSDEPDSADDEWTVVEDQELEDEEQDILREDDKIYIGDSYYNWMMNYPARLTMEYQSIAGSPIYIDDVNEQFNIMIQIIHFDEFVNNTELLDLLTALLGANQRVLDKRWVSDAKQPYGLIVSKDSNGGYFEERIYYDFNAGMIYLVFLHFTEDEDFEDLDFRAYVTELLNSFQLTFESSDLIHDITVLEDGFFTVEDEFYGVTVKLPYQWSFTYDEQYYETFLGDSYFGYEMSSIRENEMLRSWMARNHQEFRSNVGNLNHIVRSRAVTIDGIEGLMGQMSYNSNGEIYYIYDYFIYNGDYKYNFWIGFHSDIDEEEREETVKTIIESIEIGEPHSSVGYIEE